MFPWQDCELLSKNQPQQKGKELSNLHLKYTQKSSLHFPSIQTGQKPLNVWEAVLHLSSFAAFILGHPTTMAFLVTDDPTTKL